MAYKIVFTVIDFTAVLLYGKAFARKKKEKKGNK